MLLLAGSASAQWISGVKVTLDDVDQDALTVDMTASVFYTTGVTFATAFLGVDSGFGTIAPAVDWGDGSTIAPYWPGGSGIPFDQISTPPGAPGPMRAYRMAFSHAYGVAGDYNISANSHFTGGISPGIVFTGFTTTAPTPTYSIFSGVQTFLVNSVVAPVGTLTTPTVEIDTVSDVGLLILALGLGIAGFFLLRRS
ncbi:MAG: hypothetical protein GY719_37455 [bacterium]|nr:hypothetical protein [bacterium]